MMQPVLKVNLTTRETSKFEIPKQWLQEYLGGSSLAARILYDQINPDVDPLSPEAHLLFLNGPLSGTSGPVVGRFVICAKSPATQLWGEANVGGFWGPELRKAGYFGVWITGRAEEPVYLWINDEDVEIRSAVHLWGLDTYEVQDAVRDEVDAGKVRVAGIGKAGEELVPMAAVLCDHGRAGGRTGMGAVMGAKHLKAIAVRGSGKIAIVEEDRYKRLRSESNRRLRNDNLSNAFRELGTATASDYLDYLGEMPKRYFSRGEMEGVDFVSGPTIAETILAGNSACHACVIACGRVVQLPGEDYKRKGPEYETLVGFGPNLWINDAAFITRVSDLCDRYGVDVISSSNVIGFAFALFEKGVISEEDTGGLWLEWGNKEVVETLVHQIGKREGFGAQLAEGARSLGRRYGSEEDAVQVNGLEVPYHDPRGGTGTALVYATSPRGACHNQSDYFRVDMGQADEEIGLEFFERHAGAEKSANVARHQDWVTVFNSLVMCVFGNISPSEVLSLVNAAMGETWTIEDLITIGERGWNLKRAINNRLGLGRENDCLPKALLEPLPDGGSEGVVIEFEVMLMAYYKSREWDWGSGRPTKKKLKALGLGWVVDDLWPES
ncbi:aldehyde ferredoxin oxidoreductase family protein [Chloroflexota bacterium]